MASKKMVPVKRMVIREPLAAQNMRAWKFGDDIDTDAIIPGRFLTINNPDELAKHVFEGTRDEFAKNVKDGDVVVGGRNFGCGSSREHAPLAIKASGISCVIAHSFARIFFRNAINIGLPLLECAESVNNTKAGDALEIDLAKGTIKNITNGKTFTAEPYPDFMSGIISAGGLIAYTKKRLALAKA